MLGRRFLSTQRLTVIGSGQMGVGIAYVAAVNGGIPTIINDTNAESLKKGQDFVKKLLDKNVAKNKLSNEAATKALSLISTSSSLADAVGQSDIVVEAVPEKFELKSAIFSELAKLTASKSTILGSNTSSISLTKLAAVAKGAESRVIGLHFFNPVPVLTGAEIIRALQTSDEVHGAAIEFMAKVGKVASSSLDSPGFLANRILIPMINEAVMLFESGVGDAESIDNIMKNGCGFPLGPLALADLIGIDTVLSIMQVLQTETGDSKFRAANLLHNYVSAGYLGRKSGRGFYDYSK